MAKEKGHSRRRRYYQRLFSPASEVRPQCELHGASPSAVRVWHGADPTESAFGKCAFEAQPEPLAYREYLREARGPQRGSGTGENSSTGISESADRSRPAVKEAVLSDTCPCLVVRPLQAPAGSRSGCGMPFPRFSASAPDGSFAPIQELSQIPINSSAICSAEGNIMCSPLAPNW